MHTATLRAVGGSVSVMLPRQLLRTLDMTAGASVSVTLEDRRLMLSPTRPRRKLEDRVAGMKPGDMPAEQGGATYPSAVLAWRRPAR
jgi:antitoxin component of MazEF toxin-antitoxin module